MRSLLVAFLTFLCLTTVWGQNEQAPIVEKDITYKNWNLKNLRDGRDVSLRELTKGKKLVAVVYFAPWCNNWRHDAPMLERLYQKYRNDGFEIVAVGEYDPLDSIKANVDQLKISFPVVYESESREARLTTGHYTHRQQTGDTRKWGSPWYIFLEPGSFDKKGDILTRCANVINGEMVEAEGEKFIREKLGLPAEPKLVGLTKSASIEVCDTNAAGPNLTKPK